MTSTALATISDLDRYMAGISRFPVLSAEEEDRLARKWVDFGDVEAAHSLVSSNLRFVVKIAGEYKGYGAKVLDLIQEGSIGLMQAVKRFDPDRGYRLISYAVFWIRSYIHTFLMSTMRMIKVGTSRAHRKLFFKLRSMKNKLAAGGLTDRDQVLATVARETGIDRSEVEEMDRHLTIGDASLDAPKGETGTALVEVLPAETLNSEEMVAELEIEADRAAKLETAMATLDPRERRIIQERYLQEDPTQLKDIGQDMGITKQRVSQLERRALKKLKGLLREAA